MIKILTLKARPGGWHDAGPLLNALSFIAANKSPDQAMIWADIARRVRIEIEAHLDNGGFNGEAFSIELSNGEAKLLARQVSEKLQPAAYGRDVTGQPAPVQIDILYEMLRDWGQQLGFELKKARVEEDDE